MWREWRTGYDSAVDARTNGPTREQVLHPRAVLFDLDGTLAASFPAITRALNRALRESGLPEHTLDWVQRHVGRGAAALLQDAVEPRPDESVARAVGGRFSVIYREIFLDETPPLPGASDVLARVAERTSGKVAVVSNKATELCRLWLEHWRLDHHVAVVSGSDGSGARKPDPAAVAPVLGALGVHGEEALLVGDMDIDVATGRGAGIPVVVVRTAITDAPALLAAGALAVLSELRDLLPWLAANGSGWR